MTGEYLIVWSHGCGNSATQRCVFQLQSLVQRHDVPDGVATVKQLYSWDTVENSCYSDLPFSQTIWDQFIVVSSGHSDI